MYVLRKIIYFCQFCKCTELVFFFFSGFFVAFIGCKFWGDFFIIKILFYKLGGIYSLQIVIIVFPWGDCWGVYCSINSKRPIMVLSILLVSLSSYSICSYYIYNPGIKGFLFSCIQINLISRCANVV